MTVSYVFDPAGSRFTVQAFATGLLSFFGHNPTFAITGFTGQFQHPPGTLEDASVKITIKADSLQLLDRVSAHDRDDIEGRMRNEVLETSRQPEIHFEATVPDSRPLGENRYGLVLSGQLSLHGVTNNEQFEATLLVAGTAIRLTGAFSLLMSRYGIKQVTALGGAIRLKDELRFSFDIGGQQQPSERTENP